MVWKAANQRHPPVDARDIRPFGWDVKECGAVTPPVSKCTGSGTGASRRCVLQVQRRTKSVQRDEVQLLQCWTFLCGVLLLRAGDACCSPFNKHSEEDQLAEDMQEHERG